MNFAGAASALYINGFTPMIRESDDAKTISECSVIDHTMLAMGHVILHRGQKAFNLLLEARDYASKMAVSEWDYALDLKTITRHGLSQNDLRWMVYNQLLLRCDETTRSGETARTFIPGGTGRFSPASCFVLTDEGGAFAQIFQNSDAHQVTLPSPHFPTDPQESTGLAVEPTWDRDRQELRLGKKVVKRFKAPAPNQELILAAFEEEGWPVHIDDPLPPHPEQDSRRRLHDTINSLNRNQKAPLIRFLGDGRGQGVRWELAHRSTGNGVRDFVTSSA